MSYHHPDSLGCAYAVAFVCVLSMANVIYAAVTDDWPDLPAETWLFAGVGFYVLIPNVIVPKIKNILKKGESQ